jgi:mono/diheme cytochrome c family protein
MTKRSFLIFIIFFAALALAVPFWALSKEGNPSTSPAKVAVSDEESKQLFSVNCGTCHTLKRAGTDGIVGPNLDERGVQDQPDRILTAIQQGAGEGKMPAGILRGQAAEQVADFVSRVAGR